MRWNNILNDHLNPPFLPVVDVESCQLSSGWKIWSVDTFVTALPIPGLNLIAEDKQTDQWLFFPVQDVSFFFLQLSNEVVRENCSRRLKRI